MKKAPGNELNPVMAIMCLKLKLEHLMEEQNTPFVVHLRKMYIHLSQQLKLYGKYTFISTSMNFIHTPHFFLKFN